MSDPACVTAVVLSWNGRADTLACLESLRRVTYGPFEILVVDNGSTDGSPDLVTARFPEITLVRNDRNLGFAGGMNAGIAAALAAGAGHVLTLNNDMVVDARFVDALLDAHRAEPRAAAVCAQVLFADPPPRIWYAGARFAGRRGHAGRNIGYGSPPLAAATRPYETERACGGAMLASREAFAELGLFDEALFAYAEDTDWSLRARAAGRIILVAPAAVVRHKVSASSGGESAPDTLYYGVRNSLVVAERWVPRSRVGTLLRRLEAVAAHAAQALRSRRRFEGLRAVAAGWRDLRRGRLGQRP
jgi:GT2 family glycosyltransferase